MHREHRDTGVNRKMIQLAVSLTLFSIVFLGRGVLPGELHDLIAEDTDFSAIASAVLNKNTKHGAFLTALFGISHSADAEEETVANQLTESSEPSVQLIPLSQTPGHGLAHFKENGLREHAPVVEVEPESVPEDTPEVITAMAQSHSDSGEKLPSNVSFQFYELGLDQTVSPINGAITSEFGFRTGPFTGKREFHLALDIGAATGTPIRAFADGVVRYIGEDDSFGLYFMIDHDNGVSTFYAHCSKLMVRKGDKVSCGDTVALVGETGTATGPHLHFTLLKDNIRLDPAYYIDPENPSSI